MARPTVAKRRSGGRLVWAVVVLATCASPRNQQLADASAPAPEDAGGLAVDSRPADASIAPEAAAQNDLVAEPLDTAVGQQNGGPCTAAAECGSGSCVDGVCCASKACGPCQRCGSTGVCKPVTDAEDDTCRDPGKCDGAGQCVSPFAEFPVTSPLSRGDRIAIGGDGNVWFTLSGAAKIGRMTPAGSLTEFGLDSPTDRPTAIVAGPDGNVWFALPSDKLGRITPAGTITLYPVTDNSRPADLVAGSDGNIWFTQDNYNGVGRISTTGAFQQIEIFNFVDYVGEGLAAGPDGNLWVVGRTTMARVTTAGVDTRFPHSFTGEIRRITTAPDGHLWLTMPPRGSLARLSTAGQMTEVSLPDPGDPFAIVASKDGHLWFTEPARNRITRFQPGGATTRFNAPSPRAEPSDITVTPDGTLWFLEPGVRKLARLKL